MMDDEQNKKQNKKQKVIKEERGKGERRDEEGTVFTVSDDHVRIIYSSDVICLVCCIS